MSAAILAVPTAMTGDPSDVAVALEVAGALWEKGDNAEAIRWLKRAIEAAGQAGDTSRATSLAEAAADLELSLERREGAPPTAPPDRPPSPSAAPNPVVSPPEVEAAKGHERRLRVSVKTSVRDPDLLLLRPLPEGQHPPTGTCEGFLVLAEPVGGRSTSNGGGAR
jgi:hypothetical protein